MRYRVRHITEYTYGAPVSLCYNMAHLLPRDTRNQRCLHQKVQINPPPVYQNDGEDYFGNQTFYFSIQEAHKKLVIDVTTDFEIAPLDVLQWQMQSSLTCGQLRTQLSNPNTPELRMAKEYLLDSPQIRCSEDLKVYALSTFADDKPVLQAALAFTHKIFTEFKFDPTTTTVATPLEQVLKQRSGVCQDFAHLAIGCLRSVGIPARYMSGYLETLPPPGQEKLVGADASHAWFAVFIPELGWVEFDPTNDLMPSDQHIVTAWGRDYADVTPLQGVIFEGGGSQQLAVSVDVKRV
ncbi:transglutaminase family protein [Marinomonas rhizomae]|uniref:Transglutaminase-like putative cysteine protease n=1 Tax=Marinomonas rhizomae TaxID=491948 RepID=A0A366J9N2_9GAMM|nr:transglutaminase family protein [Marinomonas rhizomae]RBP83130.1 transglutaminase-like putative cysteine protease [Marinomonas rhizomae]RNF72569.1 transglutaminase family protein [Marinomonas rhizomae]